MCLIHKRNMSAAPNQLTTFLPSSNIVSKNNEIQQHTSDKGFDVKLENHRNKLFVHLKIVLVLANSTIWFLTTSMPRSSEAFSSRTIFDMEFPYIRRATARMVEVLPVPGGP
jgi:hypothetical protein